MNARVADQVVVELRMLVDQHIRAGRRAREEFERNIGGMASIADRSAAKQAAALDRAAAATEKAKQREQRAIQRAEEQRARLVIRAQRGAAALAAAEEKAAAAAERAAQKRAAAEARASAQAQREAERAAAAQERAEQRRAAMVLRLQRAMEAARQKEERDAARAAQRAERERQREEAARQRAQAVRARDLAQQAAARAREQSQGLAQIRSGLMGGVSAVGLGAVVGGGALLLGAQQLTQYADAWTNVRNKVAAAGVPLAQVPRVQEQIYQQAQKTRTSLETQAAMFQRITLAARELGRSRDEVFRFNEIVSKALKVGGATGAEAGSIATQITQAIGSGNLQGDELRSIRENSVTLAQAIAKEFGVTVGQLKKLGEEGNITSDRVFKAILTAGKEVDEQFKNLAPTFEDFATRVGNAFTRFVGLAATAAGTSREFQNAADGLVRTFEDPEVIQAAADALTEIVAAIKPMLSLVATLARNWELLVAAGAGFVALKLIETVLGLANAVRILTAAMVRNPITALLVGGAAVVGYLYEITDGFQNWSSEAKAAADEQSRLNAQVDQLQAMHPDVKAFFDAVYSGATTAADGLKSMSAEARQAAVELANLELSKSKIALIGINEQQSKVINEVKGINNLGPIALGGAPLNPDAVEEAKRYAFNLVMLDVELRRTAKGQAGYNLTAEEYAARQKELNDALAKQPAYVQKAGKALADLYRQSDTQLEKQRAINEILDAAENLPPAASEGTGGGRGGAAAGAGSGKATKEKQSSVEAFIRSLKEQVAQLGLSNTALKEAELRTQLEAAAREDLNKKLRTSATLRAEEVAQIEEAARQLTAVPAILGIARDQLPQYAEGQQRGQLQELLASLSDPKVAEALKAQGLSVEDATKAINMQIRSIDSGAKAAADAIVGIGDAFRSGIQGAQDLNDAIVKIGLSLLNLLAQGAVGQGPLGGLFNSLLGVGKGGAGLLSYFFGGGSSAVNTVASVGQSVASIGLGAGRAQGGQTLPGRLYQVGETGREWFAPSVPGQVIPNSVIKAAAGGGNGSGSPINFNISLAGANGDRTIAEIAAAAVKKGLQQVPEINRQHRIRFSPT